MLRFLADENPDNRIIKGLRKRQSALDVTRIQDVELLSADDETILEWAAENGRIMLTYDISTMVAFAYTRVRAEQSMPGVFEIDPEAKFGDVIESILIYAECSNEGEWEGQVQYLP